MLLCRTLLTLTLLTMALPALAQPTLDVRTLPRPSKSIIRTQADTTGVRPGSAGSGAVWNFSNLVPRAQYTQRYVNRNELPIAVRDSFPAAQIGVISDTTTNLFSRVGNSFRLVGTVTPSAQLTVAPDPYDTRPTEIVYDGTSTDTYRATIRVATGQTLRRSGTDTLTYDAHGTLILPSGTFTNVARLFRRTLTLDTAIVGPQTIVIRRSTRTWTYQQDTSDIELLEISEATQQVIRNGTPIGTPLTIKTVNFTGPGGSSSVDDDAVLRLAYPNPLQGAVLHIDDVNMEVADITVTNMAGASVAVDAWEHLGEAIRITMPALASGGYTIVMRSPSGELRTSIVTVLR